MAHIHMPPVPQRERKFRRRRPRSAVQASLSSDIQRLLKHHLAEYGFARALIRSGRDHDGEPVIFIETVYDRSDVPIDPRVTLRALTELRKMLVARGEERFPHLRHSFDDETKVASDK